MDTEYRALLSLVLAISLCVDTGISYSTGANPSVCNTRDMKPNHIPSLGFKDNIDGEFEIQLSTTVYNPRNTSPIAVRIFSPANTKFRGFLIQARKVGSLNYKAQGIMNGPPSLTAPLCGSAGNGLTHTRQFSNDLRAEISLTWTPPTDLCEAIKLGDLHFQATVVRQFAAAPVISIFSQVLKIQDVSGPDVDVCNNVTTTTSTPTNTVTATSTTVTTTSTTVTTTSTTVTTTQHTVDNTGTITTEPKTTNGITTNSTITNKTKDMEEENELTEPCTKPECNNNAKVVLPLTIVGVIPLLTLVLP